MSDQVVRAAASSEEYVSLPYTSNVVNPIIEVGLTKWPATGEPPLASLKRAEVLTDKARIWIGTATGFVLTPRSLYRVWARVLDTPEKPLEPVGWIVTH